MSFMSAKIEDMKTLNWPLAVVVLGALAIIGVTVVLNRDLAGVIGAITTLFFALGLAELREIKANTNGANKQQAEELAQYRRMFQDITNRALDSPPLSGGGERNDARQ